MNINPNCCASCGYKFLIADESQNAPEDLQKAKKMASREKMHFESKPLTECPQCKYVFPEISNPERLELGGKAVELLFVSNHGLSDLIKALRRYSKAFSDYAEKLRDELGPTLVHHISEVDAEHVDITLRLDDLASSLQGLRESVDAVSDDVSKAVTEYHERKSTSTRKES